MNINAQNAWLHPISREIQSNTPLRLSTLDNPNEDMQIYQVNYLMIMLSQVVKLRIKV